MLISIMLAAFTVSQGSPVTIEQVIKLPPAELGNRLLGPTRFPIVERFLYGEALEPPIPRGKPTVTRVVLYEEATESGEDGFCQKVRYMVRLKGVVADANGHLSPAPAALVSPSTLYRWKTTDGRGPACEGKGQDFLSVSDSDAQAVFAVIRDLAKVQSDALEHRPLQLTGSVDDEYGRQGYYAPGEAGPLTNWQAALKEFPVSKISRYERGGVNASGYIWRLRAAEWTVEVTLSFGAGIANLSFRRFIPPPA